MPAVPVWAPRVLRYSIHLQPATRNRNPRIWYFPLGT